MALVCRVVSQERVTIGLSNIMSKEFPLKEITKLKFMHSSHEVIILFSTDSYKSAFSICFLPSLLLIIQVPKAL